MKKVFFFALIINPWVWADPHASQQKSLCADWFKDQLNNLLTKSKDVEDLFDITEIVNDWLSVSDYINITENDQIKLKSFLTKEIESKMGEYKDYKIHASGEDHDIKFPKFFLKPSKKDYRVLTLYIYNNDEDLEDQYQITFDDKTACRVKEVTDNAGIQVIGDLYKNIFMGHWNDCSHKKQNQLTCAIDDFTKTKYEKSNESE